MIVTVKRATSQEVKKMKQGINIFGMPFFSKAQYIEYWAKRKEFPQQAEIDWEYDRKNKIIERIGNGQWRYVKKNRG